MKKTGSLLIAFVLILSVLLSGCQDKESTDNILNFENVELESDLVELAYGNFTINRDGDLVIGAQVEYRLRNLMESDQFLNSTAEFYDTSDILLYTAPTKAIDLKSKGSPGDEDATEHEATYSGENASQVSYVKIIVEERYLT